MSFVVSSPAFRTNQPIPRKYALDGENISPAIEWRDAPPETKSFVLIVENPDAPKGTFRHRGVHFGSSRHRLPENAGNKAAAIAMGAGINDFGRRRYDGPRPPKGAGAHFYRFRLAALDVPSLSLPENATVSDLWRAAIEHLVDEAETIGTYVR